MNREFFQNGITLAQSQALFRLSTDAMVLADFAAPRRGARVCDLCAGSGAVSLLLLSRDRSLQITALELQAQACALAGQNAAENGLQAQMKIVQGDLREIRSLLPQKQFTDVCCNPPYYPIDSGFAAKSEALAAARTEKYCTLEDVCSAAAWLLAEGGIFWLVHKPERLCDVLCSLRAHRLEPKRLRLVRHAEGSPAALILVAATAGGRPGLECLPELILHDAAGAPTEAYRRIYHMEDELP